MRRFTIRQLSRHLVLGTLVSALTVGLVFGVLAAVERLLWAKRPEQCQQAIFPHALVLHRNSPCVKSTWHLAPDQGVWRELSVVDPFSGRSIVTSFPARKTAGVKRVAVIGESSAALLGDALTRISADGTCHTRVEVLNCGDPSGSIDDVERRWEEVNEYDPDVTVLAFGQNVRFQWPERSWRTRIEGTLAGSCLATDVFGFRPRGFEYISTELGLSKLRSFLTRLGTAIQQRRQKLIVTALAPNYWMPPAVEIREDFVATRYALTTSLTAQQPFDPTRLGRELNAAEEFLLGVHLGRQHREDEARQHLRKAVELDVAAARVPSAANDQLRAFAASRPDLVLLKEIDATETPLGLPGWRMLVDGCHLNDQGFHSLATSIVTMLDPSVTCADTYSSSSSRAAPEATSLWRTLSGTVVNCGPHPSYSSWCQAIALAVEEHLRAEREKTEALLAGFRQSPTWTSLTPEERGDITAYFAQGYFRAGQVDRARAIMEEAVRDGGPAALTEAGFLELESGARDRAEALFSRALATQPDDSGLDRLLRLMDEDKATAKSH